VKLEDWTENPEAAPPTEEFVKDMPLAVDIPPPNPL
jgi:hypothetical protein